MTSSPNNQVNATTKTLRVLVVAVLRDPAVRYLSR